MKLSETVAPCVTCGQPVFWMAQHRECWQWEKSHGITAQNAQHRKAQIRAARHSQHVEVVHEMPAASSALEVECRAYAAAHV